jgi:hypothetical protein
MGMEMGGEKDTIENRKRSFSFDQNANNPKMERNDDCAWV